MKYLKICAFLALLCLSSGPVSAKKYPVETGRDDIVCTVKKYTQSQMLKLFSASLGNYNFDTITNESAYYMAVKLTLENNSQSTISIDSEDYLEGMGNAVIYKRLFLYKYSKLISESEIPAAPLFVAGSLASLLGFGVGGFMTFCGLLVARRDDDRIALTAIGSMLLLVMGGLGSLFFIEGISETSKNKLLNTQHAQLRKYLLSSARLKKQVSTSEDKPKEKILSPKASEFIIPPGSSFSDIFLIDLTKANRDIFETAKPKLAYEEVEQ